LELWDVARRRQVQLFTTVPSSTASFHPFLPQIFVESKDAIDCWDLETQKEIRRFEVEGKPSSIALAPDGARLAVASYARSRSILSIVRVSDGVRLTGLAMKDPIACLDWHPDARWLGAVDYGGLVQLVDSFNAESTVLGRHKAQAIHAVFSPDGGYLISGGWERELICWDLRTLDRAFTIDLDSFEARFSADGRQCAIANGSGVQIHSFELPANLRQFPEELGGRIRRAAFSPDGRWLAATGKERLGLWDLANRSPGAVAAQGADAFSILFSPDSSQLYTSRADEWFRWQVLPSTNRLTPPALTPVAMQPPEGFCSVCAASNAIVLTGARGSKLASFNSLPQEAGDWSNTVDGVTGSSPDGRWLAIFQPYTPWLHVYELPDFKTVATLTNRDNIYGFEFSPSGDQLAVSSPRRVELWDTRTWQKARELTNFMNLIFSTDSSCWWLTKDYQHGGLYDSRTLEPLLPLPNGILPLALTRDGRYLAVSVDAHLVQVWDLVSVRQEFRKLGIDWRGE
jgi:WD40 repeat protein